MRKSERPAWRAHLGQWMAVVALSACPVSVLALPSAVGLGATAGMRVTAVAGAVSAQSSSSGLPWG